MRPRCAPHAFACVGAPQQPRRPRGLHGGNSRARSPRAHSGSATKGAGRIGRPPAARRASAQRGRPCRAARLPGLAGGGAPAAAVVARAAARRFRVSNFQDGPKAANPPPKYSRSESPGSIGELTGDIPGRFERRPRDTDSLGPSARNRFPALSQPSSTNFATAAAAAVAAVVRARQAAQPGPAPRRAEPGGAVEPGAARKADSDGGAAWRRGGGSAKRAAGSGRPAGLWTLTQRLPTGISLRRWVRPGPRQVTVGVPRDQERSSESGLGASEAPPPARDSGVPEDPCPGSTRGAGARTARARAARRRVQFLKPASAGPGPGPAARDSGPAGICTGVLAPGGGRGCGAIMMAVRHRRSGRFRGSRRGCTEDSDS